MELIVIILLIVVIVLMAGCQLFSFYSDYLLKQGRALEVGKTDKTQM